MKTILLLAALISPQPYIHIAWDAEPQASKYELYRAVLVTDAQGNDSCQSWRSLGNTVGLSATDTNVLSGQRLCYAVTQWQGDAESEKSDVAVVEVP